MEMNGQEQCYSLINRTVEMLRKRRERAVNGDINCIPLPFRRFRNDLPGVEQGTYYLISGLSKASKTQITNFIFLYNSVLYAYNNPTKLRVKFFYFPLEETPEAITLRFVAFLLHDKYGIRISPTDLKSTDVEHPVPDSVLEKIDSESIQSVLRFFESHVEFLEDRNPTGVYKVVNNYAKQHGQIHYRTIKVPNKETGVEEERKLFDYYEPDDTDEYVFIIVDHVSLLDSERNLTLRETINKLSEYMVICRNRYNYIPVIVQQQSTETGNLEAFKAGKIRPTMAGLADSKYTGRDCSVMIGITNPYSFELPDYYGYNITKLKGNFRVLEVVLNRNGMSNGLCPLFFDGAINFFEECPKPTDNNINRLYEKCSSLRANKTFMMVSKVNKKLHKWINIPIFAGKFKRRK